MLRKWARRVATATAIFFGTVLTIGLLAGHQAPAVAPPPHPALVAQPARASGAPQQPDSGIWSELENGAGEVSHDPATLAKAIERFRPLMGERPREVTPGTMGVALWAAEHLTWADVAVKKNETVPARVRKDVDAERGKRLCVPPARIVEIHRQKLDGPPVFGGVLYLDEETIHFLAVKSTGTLVEGNYARMCGVVTGLLDYEDRLGRVIHATELVGMFDLPENRRP